MKISEMRVGEQIKARWLLKECEVRMTNTKPPRAYLQATLTDGIDEVRGMLWNYVKVGGLPERGKAMNLTAVVGEYNETKQLTLSRLELADNQDMSDFLPDLGFDPNVLYDIVLQLINAISDPILKEITLDLYQNYKQELLMAPAAKSVHHAGLGGLLKHQIEVCEIAYAIAGCYDAIPINRDLIIAGSLLHDMGKLKVYKYNDCLIDMADAGYMIEHIPIGIAMLEMYVSEQAVEKIRLLQHIIASHHGKLEHGSSVTPKFAEAYIVHNADVLSATFDILKTANKKAKPSDRYTAKLFTLNNYPHLLQQRIHETMSQE